MNAINIIEIIEGDITKQEVDAIVNAANNSLLGGGGVDGAIHRAAGPELKAECINLGGCETGKAKITQGYKLPASFVIHTVGPIWRGGNANEDKLLASSYKSVLQIAVNYSIKTIAFPSISTGAYGFPLERAAAIAIKEIIDFLQTDESIEAIKIVCFNEETKRAYENALHVATCK
jgi:O-acetyl-ADP-ribose deacetylase (regulator of RNase III)